MYDGLIIGEKLICPVCQKEFKVTEDTLYFVKGRPACTWKCFLEYDKQIRANKKRKKNGN